MADQNDARPSSIRLTRTRYGMGIRRCSNAVAPLNAVPADRNWDPNWAVSHLVIETMKE